MEWIKVEDSLPEEDVEVLVYGEHYFDVPIQVYLYNGIWKASYELICSMDVCYGFDSVISDQNHITHWMPLPNPPKN